MKKLLYIFGGLIILMIIIAIVASGGEKEETAQQQEKIQEQFQPKITDYDIQFTAEHLGIRKFKVSGTTNLPDGSKISIAIRDEDYSKYDTADSDWRFENLTSFGDSTTVTNGKFAKTLTASEIEAPLTSDKYEVELSLNPRGQSNDIKKIVGGNGEYLDGQLIDKKIEGLTILKTSNIITLKEEIPYKIITEENISYLGCKRVKIRITVPDNSEKSDVDYILEKLINENKSRWDDITVFAYKYSGEQEIRTIPYSMGTKEYSTCK
jgi:hypothetical protein